MHLNQYQLLPLERTSALLHDVFALPMSQASIMACTQEAAASLAGVVADIGQAVSAAAVVHADETGIRIQGKLWWLHCAVTSDLTWLAAHPQRAGAAFEDLGILGQVRGVLVHDGLVGYQKLDCVHSLCNAHHLRELTYIHEQGGEKIWDSWTQEMIDVLLLALQEVDNYGAAPLPTQRQAWYQQRWEELLQQGERQHPPVTADAYSREKRGRIKQSKAHNLLKRLRLFREEVWRFITDPSVPFTNNLAEQGLRMSKVRQKISGCFRTPRGAQVFFILRSYLDTMRKQGARLFECLVQTFKGQPVQPVL